MARRHLVDTANTQRFLTLDGKTRDPECERARFGKRRLNGSQTGSREKVKTRTLKPQGCGTLGAQARASAPGTIRR